MNALLARLLELPARQRVLLLVGVVGLLFFLYAYLFYWPRAQEISNRQAELEDLTRNRDRMAAVASNLEAARKAVADLDACIYVDRL